jgi:hypothetical protein
MGADRALIEAVLSRMRARQQWQQIYVFGAEGEPFWAAKMPLQEWELPLFSEALDLIADVEPSRPKPFIAHDSLGRFIVGALDMREELYVVLVPPAGEAASACEDAVARAREELAPYLDVLRTG